MLPALKNHYISTTHPNKKAFNDFKDASIIKNAYPYIRNKSLYCYHFRLKHWRKHSLFSELNNKLNISAPKLRHYA